MATKKHEKLFVYQSPPNPFHPPESFPGTELFVMDKRAVPGAGRTMCAWFTGPWTKEMVYKPHAHSCGETLLFVGCDASTRDLGGEIEFWIEDEQYTITKSCTVYLPPMLKHAPMWPKKITKPVLFVGVLASEEEISYYSRNPKFKDYANPPAADKINWID
jgi:hypothetical protein